VPCPGTFVKGPEPFILAQRLSFPCPVHRNRPAVIDSTLRVQLNYEIYYFSDRAARERFLRNPISYCGFLTDPVSRVRFRPKRSSLKTVYQGREYFFVDPSTRATFLALPDSFAVRRGA
jgi:YHS domain-containing protein